MEKKFPLFCNVLVTKPWRIQNTMNVPWDISGCNFRVGIFPDETKVKLVSCLGQLDKLYVFCKCVSFSIWKSSSYRYKMKDWHLSLVLVVCISLYVHGKPTNPSEFIYLSNPALVAPSLTKGENGDASSPL